MDLRVESLIIAWQSMSEVIIFKLMSLGGELGSGLNSMTPAGCSQCMEIEHV